MLAPPPGPPPAVTSARRASVTCRFLAWPRSCRAALGPGGFVAEHLGQARDPHAEVDDPLGVLPGHDLRDVAFGTGLGAGERPVDLLEVQQSGPPRRRPVRRGAGRTSPARTRPASSRGARSGDLPAPCRRRRLRRCRPGQHGHCPPGSGAPRRWPAPSAPLPMDALQVLAVDCHIVRPMLDLGPDEKQDCSWRLRFTDDIRLSRSGSVGRAGHPPSH